MFWFPPKDKKISQFLLHCQYYQARYNCAIQCRPMCQWQCIRKCHRMYGSIKVIWVTKSDFAIICIHDRAWSLTNNTELYQLTGRTNKCLKTSKMQPISDGCDGQDWQHQIRSDHNMIAKHFNLDTNITTAASVLWPVFMPSLLTSDFN